MKGRIVLNADSGHDVNRRHNNELRVISREHQSAGMLSSHLSGKHVPLSSKNLILFFLVLHLLIDFMRQSLAIFSSSMVQWPAVSQPPKQLMMNEAPNYSEEATDLPCVTLESRSNSTPLAHSPMPRKINNLLARQVFITMPAKAAGSSLKEFAKKCMKRNDPDNFINKPTLVRNFLTISSELPSIIASHLYVGDQPLIDLIKHASFRDTTIIYVHREETERLLSGIKQVLTDLVCEKVTYKIGVDVLKKFNMHSNQTHCILDEQPVVSLIEKRVHEIGMGAPEILTCRTYDSIKENAPNMLFMNYKQANKLQRVLANHHCPELLAEGGVVEANLGSKKSRTVFLRLSNTREHRIVDLDTWLRNKRGLLEWSLKLKRNTSCQAKTKRMEDDLFACQEQTLEVDPAVIHKWRGRSLIMAKISDDELKFIQSK